MENSEEACNAKFCLLLSDADLTRDKIFNTSVSKAQNKRSVITYPHHLCSIARPELVDGHLSADKIGATLILIENLLGRYVLKTREKFYRFLAYKMFAIYLIARDRLY